VATDPTRGGASRDGGPTQAAKHQPVTPAAVQDVSTRQELAPRPKLPPLPESDEELFALYVDTDSDRALREIVNRYQPKILRYFNRNSATRSRAEDLTQEVFIRIIRNRASYDRNQKFATWSKTITERIAINAARGVQRSRVTSFSDMPVDPERQDGWSMDPPDADPLPDEVAEQRETRAMLDEALQQVEERYRLPATLHFLDGLTHTEAARRLGIPVGTAKSRTHHAIEDLRLLLLQRGLDEAA
jgi:RNA polymerase sigma-70 factor (ECF subfamily)